MPIKLGRYSGGWAFGMCVYPEDGINDIEDWKQKITQGGVIIYDSCGSRLDCYDFAKVLATLPSGIVREFPEGYLEHEQAFYDKRYNLLRRKIGGDAGCIGHGDGPWDYVTGCSAMYGDVYPGGNNRNVESEEEV